MIQEILQKDLVIFGASNGGKKIFNILNEWDCNISCFVDNDDVKWEKELYGKKIAAPQTLQNLNRKTEHIVIGSMYIADISKQLDDMGLSGCYSDAFDVIKYIVENRPDYFADDVNSLSNKQSDFKYDYLITLPSGFTLGGIEVWSKHTYNLLRRANKKPKILSLKDTGSSNLIFEEDILRESVEFYEEQVDYFDYLKKLIKTVLHINPQIIIPNVSEDIYLASHIIKSLGEKFKTVAIVHSNIEFSYLQNSRYDNTVDKFICVSEEIRNKLIKRLPQREKDICTLITPIQSVDFSRQYSLNAEPIKIGYVGRLVKPDKRADYLLELIDQLEQKSVNYQLDIVGKGEYYDKLYEFIAAKNLGSKINLINGLPNDQIYTFWQGRDIFINVSDLEGTSISMLEGLYNGAVPVLTDVSGVRKFVSHGENGFIVNIGDINDMAEKIKYLEEHRELLQRYGENIHKKVAEICDPEEFIKRFIEICEN